ncbi:MAG: fused MFS/spermidine synthase [Proteobacteria bacterium]|nr:fused MFS/spermidine synthase [Pseudomonadota bacterium]
MRLMIPARASAQMPALLLALIYALSGLTSLAYEVLWARVLALQFGVSIFGVVAVTAAFMGGLGVGSLWGMRVSRHTRAPLAVFALLELGLAAYAFASPSLLRAQETMLNALAPHTGLTAWYALQGVAALLLLMLPAIVMGVGFALALKAARAAQLSLGVLYGLNTCGAALGALLPLWLLPLLGWTAALYWMAGAGLAVGIAALLLASIVPRTSDEAAEVSVHRPPALSLWAYAGIGAGALMLEIGWTRLYGMVLLRTEYVLAVLLAVFLFGIGAGSLLARRMKGAVWFSVLPLCASVFAVLSLWWLPWLSAWAEQAQFDSLAGAIIAQSLVLMLITLPVTLALGAWLPLLSQRYAQGTHSGLWLYGVNSLGAMLGAIMAGVILLPQLGAPGTVCVAALLLLVCGWVWADAPRARYAVVAASVLGLGVLMFPVRELPPVARLLPMAQADTRDLSRHEDAIAITHVIERADGQRVLLTDLQRMEAASDQAAVAVQENQARLPLLLHPAPHSVLFLGLGTGISAAGSLPYPDLDRTAVELSQGAIIAARDWFAPVNGGVLATMRVTRDDARRFLRANPAHYDVIIGDLFHPDLAGHSALLSVQQFERARARLAPGGLFVQWIALNQFDPDALDTVLESFRHVFPGAVLFVDGLHLALVGPQNHVSGAPAVLANLNRLAAGVQELATGGEGPWTWLGRYWGAIAPRAVPLQEEWAPRIEFRLPRARYGGGAHLVTLLDRMLAARPGLEQAARELQVAEADRAAFERAYVATELALRGWRMSLQGEGEDARLLRLAHEANPRDRWIGFALADAMFATLPQALKQGMDKRMALQRVLAVRPDHAEALRALWHLEQAAGDADEAKRLRARFAAAAPLDRELRAGK